MAGAPRTTMSLMARATCSAVLQLTYFFLPGRRRWSRSSSRSPRQRSGWTLDDALVAAIDRDLRCGGLREQRAAHLGGELRDVLRGNFGLEQVLLLVLLDRHVVGLGARAEQLLGPQAGVVDRVGVERVDVDPVLRPLQRGDARELVQSRLRRRIGSGAGSRRGDVARADDDDAAAARC